jgi:hypothetical protein
MSTCFANARTTFTGASDPSLVSSRTSKSNNERCVPARVSRRTVAFNSRSHKEIILPRSAPGANINAGTRPSRRTRLDALDPPSDRVSHVSRSTSPLDDAAEVAIDRTASVTHPSTIALATAPRARDAIVAIIPHHLTRTRTLTVTRSTHARARLSSSSPRRTFHSRITEGWMTRRFETQETETDRPTD